MVVERCSRLSRPMRPAAAMYTITLAANAIRWRLVPVRCVREVPIVPCLPVVFHA